MTYEIKQAYSEICTVLEYMPNEYVEKIPKKIINIFQSNKLENYEPKINKENPLDKAYLSKKAMALIAMLNYSYWCPNNKRKEELYKMYLANDKKYEEELREKYNPDNMFKKKEEKAIPIQNEQIEQETAMVEYKESIFTRIKNWFKGLFKRR